MKTIIVVLISIILLLVILFWFCQPQINVIGIGTFIVLSLTLIALVVYAYDTHIIANYSKLTWERASILNTTYLMEYIKDSKKGRTVFKIINPSSLMIKARITCEFEVYGKNVEYSDDFNGKNIWYVFPQQTSQGWFEIETLLKKQKKSINEMRDEYSDKKRDKQMTMELNIEFRDEENRTRKLPSRKHYFAFNNMRWIPVLTKKEDWIRK